LGAIEYRSREGDIPTTTGVTYALGILDAKSVGMFYLETDASEILLKPVRCEA
jgi:hypothetical protein